MLISVNNPRASGGAIKKQTNNLFLLFFAWWYHQGFLDLINYLKAVSVFLTDFFSVKLIFRTLFDPWKRDQLSYKNLSIKERFDVFILNLISRFVGLLVKTFFFVTYLVFMAGFIILSGLVVFIWLALPVIILALLFIGLFEVAVNQ